MQVEACEGLGIATVLCGKGRGNALTARARELFGLSLPAGPSSASGGTVAFIGVGPGAWLAISEGSGYEFASRLSEQLDGLASVCDQTDGYLVLRLMGPEIRDVLSRIVAVDVHERAFNVNDAAVTRAADIAVTLWRQDDHPEHAAVFNIALPRSFAESFSHALEESV